MSFIQSENNSSSSERRTLIERNQQLQASQEILRAHDNNQKRYYENDVLNQAEQLEQQQEITDKLLLLKKELNKPALPNGNTSAGTADPSPRRGSIIALLSQVLTTQAGIQGSYWKTMWDQGTTNMTTQWQLTSLSANATKEAYNQQSQATKTEADKGFRVAIIMGVAAGATIAMGALQAYKASPEVSKEVAIKKDLQQESLKNAKSELAQAEAELRAANDSPGATFQSTKPAVDKYNLAFYKEEAISLREAAKKPNLSQAEKATALSRAQVAEEKYLGVAKQQLDLNKNIASPAEKIKRLGEQGGGVLAAMSRGIEYATKASALPQMIASSAQSGVSSYYDSQKAACQAAEGSFQASVKTTDGMSQFFNQLYQRSEDIRGGVQRDFNDALDLLRKSVDSFSQTLVALARTN